MIGNIKIKKINSEIGSIIIDESKTYNSLSFKNLNDLLKAFKKFDTDKKIKVIILEGAGKGFSAGHNLKEVRGLNRLHQFDKVEIVRIERPEDSYAALDSMVNHVKEIVECNSENIEGSFKGH